MSLQRFEKKIGTSSVARSEYKLRAEVVKNLEGSLMVKKLNSNTTFWIDKAGFECNLGEGEIADFGVIINTYLGKEDIETVFKTKLRLVSVNSEKLRNLDSGKEFQGGRFMGVIRNVTITEMRGLYILDIRKSNTGEQIFARFYSALEVPMADPNRELSITINLIKSKSIITQDGRIFEKTEEREYKGEERTFIAYYPWIECVSIVG